MTLYLGNTPITGTPSNMVTTDTAQTISGEKTFTDTINMITGQNVINTSVTKGTNPSSIKYWGMFRCNDSTNSDDWHNTRLGLLEESLSTTGENIIALRAYKNEANSTKNASVTVVYETGNNRGYATAPSSDVVNSIVTTQGINKDANGYVKLGNGIIIQWGTSENISERGSLTVTLPTAFTSTNYSVTANLKAQHTTANAEGVINVDDFTTTTFRLSAGYLDPNSAPVCWLAIGY